MVGVRGRGGEILGLFWNHNFHIISQLQMFCHPAICWMTILISLFSVIGVVIMDGTVAIAPIVVYVDIHCYINLQQMVWGGMLLWYSTTLSASVAGESHGLL